MRGFVFRENAELLSSVVETLGLSDQSKWSPGSTIAMQHSLTFCTYTSPGGSRHQPCGSCLLPPPSRGVLYFPCRMLTRVMLHSLGQVYETENIGLT